MRRIIPLIAILLGLVLVAAACGSDDDSTETGSSDVPVDDDSAEEPDDALSDDDLADDDAPAQDPDDVPLGAGPYPIADLTFSVDLGNDTMTDYRLACLGDTATFTGDFGGLRAEDACVHLTEPEVRDRLLTDAHLDRICTEIYGGPEVAEITGTLDGETVNTTVNRSDGCGIDDWDQLLAGMLPAPLA